MPDRFDWRMIFTAPDMPDFAARIFDTYFTRFAAPGGSGHPCLNCGAHKCGFTFGIVTGGGFCKHCGWPCRRDHSIEVGAPLPATFFNIVLQYHPDFVEAKLDPFTGFPFRLIPERQKETVE